MQASSPRITPVILAGGTGTRLWPLSHEGMPKQFLSLGPSGMTLLEATLRRVSAPTFYSPPIITCRDNHRFLLRDALREYGTEAAAILLEPCGRNTAPAIALAARHALKNTSDAVLLVLPADHLLPDIAAFTQAIEQALPHAVQGKLVTFSVVPTRPDTGYGYIRKGVAQGEAFAIAQFTEKPDALTAADYLASEEYFWNAGIFLFRADAYLRELALHRPETAALAEKAATGLHPDHEFLRPDEAAFAAIIGESIDYAVMEHTRQGVVIPLACDWQDVGSWDAVHGISPQDEKGNALSGHVTAKDCDGCHIMAEDGLSIAAIGLTDTTIIATHTGILVTPRHRTQEVGALAATHGKALERIVHRPWGHYECIDAGEGYQVKRLTVSPHSQLSLQEHRQRDEYWTVVCGHADITRDAEQLRLGAGESIHIPRGTLHRLTNSEATPLVLIEVQSGTYLGEDDILRHADDYGRQAPRSPAFEACVKKR